MYKSKWRNPTIFEHLLGDPRKTRMLIGVLDSMNLEIKASPDNKWFDVRRKKGGG